MKFETLTAVTHLLITKFILKLAGICGFCNVGRGLCRHRDAYCIVMSRSMRYTAVDVQYAEMQDVHTFLWPLSP